MIRLLALLFLLPGWALAQDASLVADRVEIAADGSLVAEGAVEVLYGDQRLTASRVTYDPDGERLTIEGPLVLSQGGGSFLLASDAELDAGLRQGLLRSARLVLDRRLQLAADEVAQGGERFTRLTRVTASACTICESSETPLWEIRASRVIRDAEELQLYFDDAQLRVLGLPVLYLPRLRLPDPALERGAGFLVPELRSRSRLGTGLATPYFVPLGPHADVTLTPYLSPETVTLEARYRQELSFGRLAARGAVSRDELTDGGDRAFLFADGLFRLPDDYRLAFDLRLVSDRTYLLDYGISGTDRLESSVTLSRVRPDRLFVASASAFRTLRAREDAEGGTRPDRLTEFEWTDRLFAEPRLGDVWLTFSGATVERPSSEIGEGRDTARLSAELDWNAMRVLASGLVLGGEARLSHDRYLVSQDVGFGTDPARTTPAAAVSLAFPLERAGAGGARHLVEPKLRLAWSHLRGDDVPNEDSQGAEFDEGNLFAFSRFPGRDRREEGLRAEAGLTWTRDDPGGWNISATAGRIYRFEERAQFGTRAGLGDTSSDWLLAAHYRLRDRLSVQHRSLFADDLDVVRAESRLDYSGERVALAGTHLWRKADPIEDRFEDLSELTLDGDWRIDEDWSASALWRYDDDAGETTRAGLGIAWQNECMGVDLSLSRRFTSSNNVEPSTQVDFRIYLTGFGTRPGAALAKGGNPRAPRRACNG